MSRINKHIVKEDQFIPTSQPKTAYLLGLIWADGCLSQRRGGAEKMIKISLIVDDMENIEDIFDSVGVWNKSICKYSSKHKNWKDQKTLYIYNKNLFDYLSLYNYCSKSGDATILNNIPKDLQHYWIRGFLDGDGTIDIDRNRVHFESCFDQDWSFMKSLCERLHIKYSIRKNIRNKGKSSTFCVLGYDDIKVLLDFIYAGDQIGLDRKRLKYEAFTAKYLKRHIRKSKHKNIYLDSNHKFWFYRTIKNGIRIEKRGFDTEDDAFNAYLLI